MIGAETIISADVLSLDFSVKILIFSFLHQTATETDSIPSSNMRSALLSKLFSFLEDDTV